MKKADLIEKFVASLGNSAGQFKTDNERILENALAVFSVYKPRVGIANLTLENNKTVYDAPADLIGFKHHDWGRAHRRRRDPWNQPRVVKIPDVKVIPGDLPGTPYRLALSESPSEQDLSICGVDFQYFYTAKHQVSDDDTGTPGATTVEDKDIFLLLLRMQVEAMKEMALNRIGRANVRDPGNKGKTRTGSPETLKKELEKEFERMVRL